MTDIGAALDPPAGGDVATGRQPGEVARPRLIRKLSGAGTPVILLNAPSGYGKSVLIDQWREDDVRPFTSVLLGEQHNDPALLLASIMEALGRIEPVSPDVMAALNSPSPSIESVVLPRLRNELAGREIAMVLVLDELEHIESPQSLAVVSALGASLKYGSQLVIASRTEPAIPIGSLRAHRSLTEFGVPDLLMSKSECEVLIEGLGLSLNPKQLDLLMQRTEGWPVAIYLAALAFAAQPDLSTAISEFAGDDRIIVDYISEEFLASISDRRLEFLRQASVLDRLSGSLCDEVLCRTDSAGLLRDMSRSNMLLTPLDRKDEWFRFHPLFREMLNSELRRTEPEAIPALQTRASEWWAAHGDWDRAIQHAVESGDVTRAGELIWASAPDYMSRGRNASIVAWLDRLGEDAVASDAALSLSAAFAHITGGSGARAEYWASVADTQLVARKRSPEMTEWLSAGIAVAEAALCRNGLEDMMTRALRAEVSLPKDSPWRSACCLFVGVSLQLRGFRELASERLKESVRRGSVAAPSIQVLSLAQLTLLATEEEDWHRAAQLTGQARAQIKMAGLADTPIMALAFAASALVRAQTGMLDKAAEDLEQASRLLGQLAEFPPWIEVETLVALARTAARLGDGPQAAALLSQGRLRLREIPDGPVLEDWVAEAAFTVGKVEDAEIDLLTPAELRMLEYLPTHLTFPQIAEKVFVSPNTVKTHAQSIYRKLGVSSRREAVERAQAAGLFGNGGPVSEPFGD